MVSLGSGQVLLLAALLALAGTVSASGTTVERLVDSLQGPTQAPPGPDDLPVGGPLVDWMDPGGDEATAPPGDPGPGGIGQKLRDALQDHAWIAGLAGMLATVFGVGGFALVTRYISPKEALKNPQRAMLFGFIKATPGAHLKQLSEEFNMKTSSILWHIRKLESADLVRSERANGFRVFYTVAGGVEMKQLSRAITALQNDNARVIQELVERHPGTTVKATSERLDIHSGTVRWHLRKLREFGLVEELVRDDGSRFYSTPLGRKAMEALLGVPLTPTVRPARRAYPVK